jgi:hypothetical protein
LPALARLRIVRTITVAARFEHPPDVTLAELRVQLSHLHDDEAERFFRGAAADRALAR